MRKSFCIGCDSRDSHLLKLFYREKRRKKPIREFYISSVTTVILLNFDGGAAVRERSIEQKLVSEVKKRRGICPKWVSPGFDGVPDRIVLLPGRHIGFVEVKASGEKPRALQVSRHKLLARLGFHTHIIDGKEQIGGVLDEIQSA